MKPIINLSLAALLAITAGAATAATGKGVGVRDLGKDGDERFHEITCADQRTLVVTVNYELKRACFPLNDGKEHCLKTTDIRAAGERACSMTK